MPAYPTDSPRHPHNKALLLHQVAVEKWGPGAEIQLADLKRLVRLGLKTISDSSVNQYVRLLKDMDLIDCDDKNTGKASKTLKLLDPEGSLAQVVEEPLVEVPSL